MRKIEDKYQCVYCEAVFEIPIGATPKVLFKAASGQPNIRVLSVDGREVHRCEVPSTILRR